MELYNLIIYKIVVFHIPQKNRIIKKVYYKKTGIIENVSSKDINTLTLDLYRQLDTNYIIVNVNKKDANNEIYDYYEKLNKKSLKMYLELKNNKDLIQFNSEYKKQHFTLKYNANKYDINIIKKLLKDID